MNRAMLVACALIAFCTSQVSAQPPKPGEVREVELGGGLKMKLCWIPPGEVQLGAPEDEQDYVTGRFLGGVRPGWMDAESANKCGKFATKGFWLGKFAVTQSEWHAVMGANLSWFSKDGNGRQKVAGLDSGRFPVEQVSWDDCAAFLKKLNDLAGQKAPFGKPGRFVLPHESEWEYACRGGRGIATAFYFGDALNGQQANCDARRNPPFGVQAPNSDRYRKALAQLHAPMRPGIEQATELPLSSWLEQFRQNLEGTSFYIRVNEESLLHDPPIRAFGDESPRITIRGLPGASTDRVMNEVLAQFDLTCLVHEDHLEILRKAHVGKLIDHEPIYRRGASPSENYKKTVARLKSAMKPGVERTTEVPLSYWLKTFQDRLDGTGFSIRVNKDSLARAPAIPVSENESPRVRCQYLLGATLETVMTEVLWKQNLTFAVNDDHIEILKNVDAARQARDYGGITLKRTAEVGQYEKVSPHPWGLCDMHGNVWQWCENWYDGEHKNRALRGGSWNASPADCRTAHRVGAPADRRSNDSGLRVCFRPE